MGRSRGGLTTKIHALVDADGRPVRLELTAGEAADAPAPEKLLSDLRPGATILADKAYDTDAIRNFAKQRKCWTNISAKANRKQTFSFSRWVYRQHNLVERFFNRIKQMRGLATRYDRRADNSWPPSSLPRRGYGSPQLMSSWPSSSPAILTISTDQFS